MSVISTVSDFDFRVGRGLLIDTFASRRSQHYQFEIIFVNKGAQFKYVDEYSLTQHQLMPIGNS